MKQHNETYKAAKVKIKIQDRFLPRVKVLFVLVY